MEKITRTLQECRDLVAKELGLDDWDQIEDMVADLYSYNTEPTIVNEKTKKAVELIRAIYDHPKGAAGGPAHIVTDDGNLDKDSIIFCLNNIADEEDEQLKLIAKECLEYLLHLTEEELYSSYDMHNRFS